MCFPHVVISNLWVWRTEKFYTPGPAVHGKPTTQGSNSYKNCPGTSIQAKNVIKFMWLLINTIHHVRHENLHVFHIFVQFFQTSIRFFYKVGNKSSFHSGSPAGNCCSGWKGGTSNKKSTDLKLAGGFKYFSCLTLLGEDSHFDEHIFQLGWNHQLVKQLNDHCLWFDCLSPPATVKTVFHEKRVVLFEHSPPSHVFSLVFTIHWNREMSIHWATRRV